MLRDRRITEASGLAVSRRQPDLLWAINDSGAQPELYALRPNGTVVAAVAVPGARNRDWEDLAAFRLGGKPYLLIADVGDNAARRSYYTLYVVEEPDLSRAGARPQARVAWRLHFRYPDGPRDSEAVAVDEQDEAILLLSKQRHPALYRLPLRAAAARMLTARRLGDLAGIPQPAVADHFLRPVTGYFQGRPTAMDISADGSAAVVLTYKYAYRYPRLAGEPWAAAFARRPQWIALPYLRQAEALAVSADGSRIFVTSEKLPAPVLHLDRIGPRAAAP